MPHVTDAPRPAAARFPPRRVAVVLAVWAGLAGSALLVANALDSPVGAGARDEAQPAVPEQSATPVAPADPAAAALAALPPFAMVLDHTMPTGVAGLAPIRQAQELRVRAMSTKDPARFVELGSVLQVLGDLQSAEFSYRSALKFDPQNVAARVGLAVVDGGSGSAGLARASSRLKALAAARPGDQLISFNQGWVAMYQGRNTAARATLKRTAALAPQTRLGRTATALRAALGTFETAPAP